MTPNPPHLPPPDNFLLGFPTSARHPYSLIVITAIIFTYQPRNGNWDYYSRQGLNWGAKFHGKHNTARWPLGKWLRCIQVPSPTHEHCAFSFEPFVLRVEGSRSHNGSLLDDCSGRRATRLHGARSRSGSFFSGGLARADSPHVGNLLTSGTACLTSVGNFFSVCLYSYSNRKRIPQRQEVKL